MAGLLRREVRETQLYLDAVVRMLGKEKVEQNIGAWQFENETLIENLLGARVFYAIRGLWPGRGKSVTLEDLASFARVDIAMAVLDAAMIEHGLEWADAEGGES